MISLNYLKQVLPTLAEFKEDIDSKVFEGEGYDGVIAILENIRGITLPAVIIEDRAMGNIRIDSGPVDSYSLPVWVMVEKNRDNNSVSGAYASAFELGKKILKLFIRDANTSLQGIDFSNIQYSKREATDCYGYEFLITFRCDIDLSL